MSFWKSTCSLILINFILMVTAVYSRAHVGNTSLRSLSDFDRIKEISAIVADDRGSVWIASANGLFRFDGYTKTAYTTGQEPGQRLVQHLSLDRKQGLWIGTRDGLMRYDRQLNQINGYGRDGDGSLSSQNITHIFMDRVGTLWVGTADAGLNRFQKDRFITYVHEDEDHYSISGDGVSQIIDDSFGNLWIGTDAGLNRFDRVAEKFSSFTNSNGSNQVTTLYFDRQGRLWVGTVAGLFQFHKIGSRFELFPIDVLGNTPHINHITEDLNGHLWVAGPSGLAYYHGTENQWTVIEQNDGVTGIQSLLVDSNGMLWIGTKASGLFLYDTNEHNGTSNEAKIPPVVISDVQLFHQSLKVGDESPVPLEKAISEIETLVLPPESHILSFEFSINQQRNPQGNRFAYRLEPIDRDWVHVESDRRFASYSNLPDGQYVFRVKAYHEADGWESEEAQLKVYIEPSFWRTWWAQLGYLLILCLFFLGFFLNQKKKLAEVHALNLRLKEADRIKDRFLANITYELKTPLEGIGCIAEKMRESSMLAPNLDDNVDLIISSGKRLESLVNDILDFSEMNHRDLLLDLEDVDFNLLVGDVLRHYEPLFVDHEIQFQSHVLDDIPHVWADRKRLAQILHNLIGNAVKYTEKGKITVSAKVIDDFLEVTVADTGKGISIDRQSQVFQPIVRDDGDGEVGSGFGLAITQKLVEQHGGYIHVQSELNKGTVFTFSVPCYREDMANTPQVRPVQVKHSENRERRSATMNLDPRLFKILIVDDEPVNRRVITNHLTNLNYKVTEVPGGREALEAMEDDRFDLILLDVMMPHMSGYEVCTELRRHFTVQELPIIMLTAKAQVADLMQGFDCGANDYLTKPIDKGALLSRVKTHLELLTLNRNLEQKVIERTRELREKNDSLDAKCQELETLDTIVKTINRELEFQAVIHTLLEQALIMFPEADHTMLVLFSRGTRSFSYLGCKGHSAKWDGDNQFGQELFFSRFEEGKEELAEGLYLIERGTEEDMPATTFVMTIPLDESQTAYLILENLEYPDAFRGLELLKNLRFREHTISALSKAKVFKDIVGTQKDLAEASRKAGMAEIATDVLHNVGNSLNSVRTTSDLIRDKIGRCEDGVKLLQRVSDLVSEHDSDLGTFFTEDRRSQMIPKALNEISKKLMNQIDDMSKNAFSMGAYIEDMVDELRAQQEVSQFDEETAEPTDLNELVRQSLNMKNYLLKDKGISLLKNFQAVDIAVVEPSKLTRTIFYLLENAWEAIKEQGVEEGRIEVVTCNIEGFVQIIIIDNGNGISEENLDLVFRQGFTTKEEKKGFGLHYCANALKEMEGKIELVSQGPGQGTQVILSLPKYKEATKPLDHDENQSKAV